jgi:hypothetical protein
MTSYSFDLKLKSVKRLSLALERPTSNLIPIHFPSYSPTFIMASPALETLLSEIATKRIINHRASPASPPKAAYVHPSRIVLSAPRRALKYAARAIAETLFTAFALEIQRQLDAGFKDISFSSTALEGGHLAFTIGKMNECCTHGIRHGGSSAATVIAEVYALVDKELRKVQELEVLARLFRESVCAHAEEIHSEIWEDVQDINTIVFDTTDPAVRDQYRYCLRLLRAISTHYGYLHSCRLLDNDYFETIRKILEKSCSHNVDLLLIAVVDLMSKGGFTPSRWLGAMQSTGSGFWNCISAW